MEKEKNLRQLIGELIGDGQVGTGKAIKLCKEHGISPKEFGRIVARGRCVEVLKNKNGKDVVVSYLYDREIKIEDKDQIRKRVLRREAQEKIKKNKAARTIRTDGTTNCRK